MPLIGKAWNLITEFADRMKIRLNKTIPYLFLFGLAGSFVDGMYYGFVFLPNYYGDGYYWLKHWMSVDAAFEYIKEPAGILLTLAWLLPWGLAVIILRFCD